MAVPVRQQGSSSAVKIVLLIVGGFILLGVLGVGSCMYVAYRARAGLNRLAQTTPYHGVKDPCRLVTQAEVSDALGSPVEAGTAQGDRRCEFVSVLAGGGRLGYDVTWEGGAMAMKIMTMALKAKGDASTAMNPVPGLGEEAYVGPMGMGLFMRKGDVLVMIDMRQAPFNVEAAKRIAAIIANRL